MIKAAEMADANAKGDRSCDSKEHSDERKAGSPVGTLSSLTLNLCDLSADGLEVRLGVALHLLSQVPELGSVGVRLRSVDPQQGEAGEGYHKGKADDYDERTFGPNPVLRLDETGVGRFEKHGQHG